MQLKKKMTSVRVITAEAELDFAVKDNIQGVARTIGLREVWYFGLVYSSKDKERNWLNLNQKLSSIDIEKTTPLIFELKAKFYPEDATKELIQEITQRLFFLQVKQSLLSDELQCPPETAILLASYACQAKFGDYDESKFQLSTLSLDRLIPPSVTKIHELNEEEWINVIAKWYKEHRGTTQQAAMLSYLEIAQDLVNYGVDFFEIRNKRGTNLLLGIDSMGLAVYKLPDTKLAKVGFPWSEIRNITFSDKKFTIKPNEKKAPEFVFYTQHLKANKRIMALCVGNNELYVRRRQPESIEVQQMRAQANEDSLVKALERQRFQREMQGREEAERRVRHLEERLSQVQMKAAIGSTSNVSLLNEHELILPKLASPNNPIPSHTYAVSKVPPVIDSVLTADESGAAFTRNGPGASLILDPNTADGDILETPVYATSTSFLENSCPSRNMGDSLHKLDSPSYKFKVNLDKEQKSSPTVSGEQVALAKFESMTDSNLVPSHFGVAMNSVNVHQPRVEETFIQKKGFRAISSAKFTNHLRDGQRDKQQKTRAKSLQNRPPFDIYKKPNTMLSVAPFPHHSGSRSTNTNSSITPRDSESFLGDDVDDEDDDVDKTQTISSESTTAGFDFPPPMVPSLRSEELRKSTVSKDAVLSSKLRGLRDELRSKQIREHPLQSVDVQIGDTKNKSKFDTLRNIRRGNTRKRIDEFEAM